MDYAAWTMQNNTWLVWATFAHGGTIEQTLGEMPSDWGTLPGNQPPSINKH